MHKSKLIRVSKIALLLCIATLQARSPVDPVNRGPDRLALHGYDPVAYFTENRPVKGDPAISYEWMGAQWRFSKAEDRDLFSKNPEQYAPQFGGYCAWAVGHNYTADIDPNAWRIVGGKLYLNYNRDVQKKWEQDRGTWIERANRNWPGLRR